MYNKNSISFVVFLVFAFLGLILSSTTAQAQTPTKLDLVVVADTSSPIQPFISDICANLASEIDEMNAIGEYDIDYRLLGITESTSCLTQNVTSLFATTLSNDREDWGPAVQDVAAQYAWRADALRVVVSLGDECPDGGGFTCNNADFDSLDAAHTTADVRDVTMFAITLNTSSGSPEVSAMGDRLVDGISHGPHDSSKHFNTGETASVTPAIQSFVAKLLGYTGRTPMGPGDYCKYTGPQGTRDALSYIEYSSEYSDLDTQQKANIDALVVGGYRDPVGLVACGRDCDDPTTLVNEAEDCGFCSFFQLIDSLIKTIMFKIAPAVAIFWIVLGGILLILSRGNPGKTTTARNMILYAIAGYALMFIAWMLINSIFSGIGVKRWTGLTGESGQIVDLDDLGGDITIDKLITDSTDWNDDEFNNLMITITEAATPSFVGQSRRIIDTQAPNMLVTENWGSPAPGGGQKFRIGGWWQFSCGQ